MLNIGICDDMLDQLEVISNYINEYIEFNSIDAQVQEFTNPDALLRVCETESFHIYILDIVMPMINGIELGKEIRRIDRQAQIIYASTEKSFALDSFSANPINYLIKPIDKSQLFETLDLAISRVNTDEEEVITLKTKEGIRVVKLSSIIYCEYTNHFVQYILMGGETINTLTIQESFSQHTESLLVNKRFIQPHSAFVVNMTKVEKFLKDGFVMRGGGIVPIPLKKYPIVREKYMDYLLDQEGN